jgi:hypothetical protein
MGRTLASKKDGQALVEFAILLPVLLLLLLGIIEFGLLLFNQHVITNASREGARYGIVSRSPRREVAEIEAVVAAYCGDHLVTFGDGDDEPTTTVLPDPTTGSVFGDDLKVEVAFDYEFFVLPQFLADLAGVTELRATTTMKYE